MKILTYGSLVAIVLTSLSFNIFRNQSSDQAIARKFDVDINLLRDGDDDFDFRNSFTEVTYGKSKYQSSYLFPRKTMAHIEMILEEKQELNHLQARICITKGDFVDKSTEYLYSKSDECEFFEIINVQFHDGDVVSLPSYVDPLAQYEIYVVES